MIRLAIRVPAEHAEEVLAELLELAPAGVEETALEDGRIEFAVYGPPGELPALPELNALAGDAPVEISTREIADDWQERWKHFHRPVLITAGGDSGSGGAGAAASRDVPSIRVRPPWEPPAEGRHGDVVELVIDPGQAFGTGGHASTRLCLGLLLGLLACEGPDRAVLDVGTGSGVLAIAAGRLGFEPLLALDNEDPSVAAAAMNAAANGVVLETARFDLRRDRLPWLGPNGVRTDPEGSRTVVLANLLRPLLLDLAGSIAHAPAALIAGGLLRDELDEVSQAFAIQHGLRERRRLYEGDWGALWLAVDRHDRPQPPGSRARLRR